MAKHLTMRPKKLTLEMVYLIEQQATGLESMTLPGEIVVQLAERAKDAMQAPTAACGDGELVEASSRDQAKKDAAFARLMLAFMTPGQVNALTEVLAGR